jgi:hypothetical protein
MTAVSAGEDSLSSKRSWNLTAELSPICLSAGGAESALGPIKAAPWRPPFHGGAFLVAAMGSVLRSGATSRPYSPLARTPDGAAACRRCQRCSEGMVHRPATGARLRICWSDRPLRTRGRSPAAFVACRHWCQRNSANKKRRRVGVGSRRGRPRVDIAWLICGDLRGLLRTVQRQAGAVHASTRVRSVYFATGKVLRSRRTKSGAGSGLPES